MNEQEQMMQIISAISEKTGETPEKVVAMLQEIMQTEGQEGVKAFIDKILNPEAEMFRKGGKMEAAVNKFQRGGLARRSAVINAAKERYGYQDSIQAGDAYRNLKTSMRNAGMSRFDAKRKAQNILMGKDDIATRSIDASAVNSVNSPISLNKAKFNEYKKPISVTEYSGSKEQQYNDMMKDKMTTRIPFNTIGTQADPREASLREAPWRANWGMAHDAMFMGGTGEPIVFNNNQHQQISPETKPSFGSRLASALMMGAPTMKEKGGKINKCQGGDDIYLKRYEKSHLPDGRIVERLGNWVDVHDDDIDTVSLNVRENGDTVAMIVPRRTTDGHTWIRQMNGKWQDPNRYMVRSPHWTLNASKDELIDFIRSSFKNVKFKD